MLFNHRKFFAARFVVILALLSVLVRTAPAHAQSIIHRVAPNGATSGSCGADWLNPCDLQYALTTLASAGDEIWVAAGTYKPTTTTDRTISFTLKNGVAVYGGFAGMETERAQRDYEANLTILSGDIGAAGNSADNSYHVVVGSDVDSSAILDGFSVIGGYATGASPYDSGGGMYIQNGYPGLLHMTFTNNRALFGGGIANVNGKPALQDVIFEQNTASNNGGGMYILGGNPALMNVSFISRNNAPTGGGIGNVNGNPVLENVTFHDGVAQNGAGMSNKNGEPILKNVTFSENRVTGSGGAMYNEASNPTITNSIFWADIGGEIANIDGSVPVVTYSIVQGGFDGTGNLDLNPYLGKIAKNGGFTKTMALGAESPAIDSGDDANCTAKDQRGLPRPQESHCDIGAYEYQMSVIYVKHDAMGGNNGASWTNAYTDLQSALADASSGDEIWVAAGTYKPTSTTNRALSFTLKDSIAVYGGFAGTETLHSQRDFDNNVTVLSGDIGVEGDNSDNSYHVVVGNNIGNSAILDGFAIIGGNANSDSGGGMYVNKGSPRVSHVIFRNNYATFGGGMITIGDYYNPIAPILTDVTFLNNSATEGGGMRNQDYSSPTLTNVVFDGNSVIRTGGGMENFNYSSPVLTDVTFSNNTAGDLGAGGGMFNWVGNNPTLTNVTFSGNTAKWGGGMGNYQSSPSLTNVTFNGNSVTSFGGGISNEGNSKPTLTNVTVSGNSADTFGGGVYNDASGSNTTIRNSILYGNSGGEIYNVSGAANVTYSIVQGGYPGTGNINADPLLGPLQNNGGLTQTLAIDTNSPALNSGNITYCPSTDQRGISRPQGSGCDIGAYEDQSLVRYVDQDATGDHDGSSWINAHPDLQSALAAASPDEEIWVAAGTYKPTSTTDRTISFNLKNGVAIYGGFAGTETSREQRDYGNNVTILSGDIGVEGDNSDNSYHVVVGSNTNNSAILDGFTVTAGNANDTTSSQYYFGGGVYINKGSPCLNEMIFTDNHAGFGGGIYASHTEGGNTTIDLILTNAVFRDNTASGEGGGMATLFSPDLSSASFSLSLSDVLFENNTAVRTGGGMINNGGELELVNVTFSGNTAAGGGGLSNIPYGPSTLTNVTFSDNSASDGGGGLLVGSSGPAVTTLTYVTFNNNSTTMNGGGIVNAGYSELTLTNVTFSDNIAGVNGGGISNGGIFGIESGGTVNLINTTFSNNTATSSGSAMYNESGNINIHNSILYGDTGGEIANTSGAAVVTYSIVQGGYIGVGNLDEDPLLGPLQDNGGFTQTMALGAGSPAIDAADDTNCPDTDQRGVTRPQRSHCDIGAYEYDGPDSTVDVIIGTSEVASYVLSPHESQRRSYADINSGPVQVVSNVDILAAERVIYKVNNVLTSFSEMMGLPANQVDNVYWLPWYNNTALDTQLRIANVTANPASVQVTIGGVEMEPFILVAGESTRKSYPGVNDGPVKIESDQDIVAAERVIYKVNGVFTSFSEMMALPESQLDNVYWLPWYNNFGLDTQLRIGNVSGSTATVHIFIGGDEVTPVEGITLLAGDSTRVSYPVNDGPVQIVSDQDIVAAERVIYTVNGVPTSFSEMMALPNSQLSTTYWMPWYNNFALDTQLRFANTTNSTATVHVYIGGVEMQNSPFILSASDSTRVSFDGVNDGPVQIVSDQDIVVAERVIYKVNNIQTSFSEMMALPNALLDATFWFPWYNNVGLDTQLRFGVP